MGSYTKIKEEPNMTYEIKKPTVQISEWKTLKNPRTGRPMYSQNCKYAYCIDSETGEVVAITIKSYNTIVASILFLGGAEILTRHWDGYSVTTLKHINAVLDIFDMEHTNKAKWLAEPINYIPR